MSKRCCCCPCDQGSGKGKLTKFSTLTMMIGPTPFSPNGVSPYFIQIMNPELFKKNEHEEDGGSSTKIGLDEDPNYPSDSRSDPLAWTPMYRGGQNAVFDAQLDPYMFHGAGSESLFYCQGGDWNNLYWDGTTFPIWIQNTATEEEKAAHRAAWYEYLFPSDGFCMRGLKQLYDANMPFKDEAHPTVHEWELWNDLVLNHFRFLSGLSPAYPSPELYIMCAWTRERKTTTMWDSKYPGTFDSAYGPCVGGTNLHCGTTFKPSDLDDQSPYWNEVFTKYPKVVVPPLITLNQGSEAVTVWYNGTAMTALSRNIRNLVRSARDGTQIGGHAGPYCFRSLYGLAIGRSKWAGSLQQPPTGYTY